MALRRIVLIFLLIFSPPFFSQKVLAQTKNLLPAITVINLIRGNGLGHENEDLASSLKAQWQVTKEASVSATWLFQYGALINPNITDFVKDSMPGQEFGLLFEIDRTYAEQSGVKFRGQGAWFFSDGLFLVSYDRLERKQLIDTAFRKFREVFGYYPKTVGAWWIGGDSLTYMQQKYHITAALRAADQYQLDFYTFWGTPWSIPYLASSLHEGIPAASYDTSSKVVILQWAVRDPVNGYSDPLYSVQDYGVKNYTSDYVLHLSDTFLRYPLQNMVFGLENGGTLADFRNFYEISLKTVKELELKQKGHIELAKDYSARFLYEKKVFPFPSYFLSKDYTSDNQSFWYISENYRALLRRDSGQIYVADIRDYSKKIEEDFSILPNSQARLVINVPSQADSIRIPQEKIFIASDSGTLAVRENGNEVTVYSGTQKVASFNQAQMWIFPLQGKQQTFRFTSSQILFSPRYIILGIYIVYCIILFLVKRKIFPTLFWLLPLLPPLIFALPMLRSNITILFDKKEIVLFPIVLLVPFFSIYQSIILLKAFPFIILVAVHFFTTMFSGNRTVRVMYYFFLIAITYLYVHIPYFPLDKTTYPKVIAFGSILGGIVGLCVLFTFLKVQSRKVRITIFVGVPLFFLSLVSVICFSRSRLAVTWYEIAALEKIKNQKKDVLYIEQVDYSILPIYKAVKPILYDAFWLQKVLTGHKWDIERRPEDNILKPTGYEDKIIIIPRYLGSDLSDYEITMLKLKNIYDNAHIALYEKETD